MFNFLSFIQLDTPTPWGLFFQDSATPQMEGLEELHNNIMFYLAIILFSVTWMMITIIRNFVSSKSPISHKYMNHGKFVPIQKSFKFNNIFQYFVSFPFLFTLSICLFFFLIGSLLLFIIYNHVMSTEIINYAKDNNIDLHAHGHVSVDKEAGIAIGQGLNTIGSQIGLGATMIGVGGAVGKTIAKSGIPPLQKVGFVVGSSLIGGFAHSWISNANRSAIRAEDTTYISNANINTSTDISSSVSKFMDSYNISPLQEFLFDGEMMNSVCIGIMYLLIIQLVFKLYFKESISLNFFKLLNNNLNIKIESYLNKIIKLNKQMSIVWIWFGFISITFGLCIAAYALNKICLNLDNFIHGHLSFNPDIINNSQDITNISIKGILYNLKIINYISLITIIILMLQIMLKFHYNQKINNIYIWLLISILILTLAYSAYTYGELYTHVDSYVKMYITLTN